LLITVEKHSKEIEMKYSLALALISLTLIGCGDSTVTTDAATTEANTIAFNTSNAPTVQFEVPDMMCEEGCAATVKEVLKAQPGAMDVKVEFDKKLATVAVDEKFDKDAAVAALLDKQFPNTKLFAAPEKPSEPSAPKAPSEPEPKDG
jgi:copper chaperone CopZ